MINDVKDLSLQEKKKALARREFMRCTGICIAPLLVSVVGMTLFSIYMSGNFEQAFQPNEALSTAGRFVSVFLVMVLLYSGIYSYTEKKSLCVRNVILVLMMVTITFFACVATSKFFNIYAMPIALATLVIIELLDRRTAALSTVVIAVLLIMPYLFRPDVSLDVLGEALASIICNAGGAVIINFYVDKHFSRLKFLLISLAVAWVAQPLVVTFTLASRDFSINLLFNVLWSYGANVAAILVFMPLVAIFEGAFNIADDFRLNELCNLSNPLLKRLASEAPGTFNHSLVVGNLAEACATAIGENPNMARCAAYYHDIGKLKAPIYFSENQSTYNPHDELIPEVSVSMITSHALFGEILAKQNRLPPEIVAVCREHHGTAPVGYFYRKALTLKEEGELAVDKYTYPGPKPQTKIAAIIMICDTVEAAVRAYTPENVVEFEERINKLVDEKLALRQFDECPITMGDIAIIKQTVSEVLRGVYHSRINYDKKKIGSIAK